jgi:hypothetical protein
MPGDENQLSFFSRTGTNYSACVETIGAKMAALAYKLTVDSMDAVHFEGLHLFARQTQVILRRTITLGSERPCNSALPLPHAGFHMLLVKCAVPFWFRPGLAHSTVLAARSGLGRRRSTADDLERPVGCVAVDLT